MNRLRHLTARLYPTPPCLTQVTPFPLDPVSPRFFSTQQDIRARSISRKPSRVTDLYRAIVYEDKRPVEVRRLVVHNLDGTPAPEDINNRIRNTLQDYRQGGHAAEAIELLSELDHNGYVPTARAVVLAIETCLASGELQMAENALNNMPRGDEGLLGKSARSLVGMAYTQAGQYGDALRVMNEQKIGWGKDSVAWGVLVKALTKMGREAEAVQVVDEAIKQGAAITDGLLHLAIDAFRGVGSYREAIWLFEESIRKGVIVSERTIASMLMMMMGNRGEKGVTIDKMVELVDMIQDPTPRFTSTALMVFMHAGLLERAEDAFKALQEVADDGVPEEIVFASMMGVYGNFVESGWEREGQELPNMHADIDRKVDEHWKTYLELYGSTKTEKRHSKVWRQAILTRYLRAKVRCFKVPEAVDVLEEIANKTDRYRRFEIQSVQLSAVLGSIELRCDVEQMKRVLKIMKEVGVKQDARSLGLCIGTCVGNGDLYAALELVRQTTPSLLAGKSGEHGYENRARSYQWKVLLRRLVVLQNGFNERGAKVKDLEDVVLQVRSRAGSAAQTINRS